ATPLCRDVNLAAVPWVAATRRDPAAVREAYILAGRRPLYWRSDAGRLHLNIAVDRSPLVRETAWPVLMANLAAMARENLPGLGRNVYRPAEPLRYRSPDGTSGDLTIERVDGEGVPAALATPGPVPGEAGLYRLLDGGEDAGLFSVLPGYGPAADTTGLADRKTTTTVADGGGTRMRDIDLAWLALLAAMAAIAIGGMPSRASGTTARS
ncbi:MAG: hypothetical protein LIP77_05865, partial [Planctomycetes bacterium]|nr:hypothetical protein [Planctomycetota bacterium]